MADRKITDFLTQSALKSNTLFAVVDPDEAAAADQNKKIATSAMLTTFEAAFSKNTAFNKNFGGTGAATTVARSDHNHSGVYEPVFTKNTAFNKDFGTGSGQVAEGDHLHTGVYQPAFTLASLAAGDLAYYNGSKWINNTPELNWNDDVSWSPAPALNDFLRHDGTKWTNEPVQLIFNSDISFSTRVAGDVLYYNGSAWTNLGNAQAKNTYSYWNNGGSGTDIAYSAGNVTIGNGLILTVAPDDTGFATSQLLTRDSSGIVDKIAASGGGTTNFLRADGTWAAPPGGSGGTPGGATDEVQKNDGASGFAGTKVFSTTDGDLTLGTGVAGATRTIAASGVPPVDLVLTPTGVASDLYLGQGTTSGSLLLGTTGSVGTERRIGMAGTETNIDLLISPKGTGKVYWYDGANNQEMGIVDGGSSTQNGATYTVDCGDQQSYLEAISTDNTTSTWTISNFGLNAVLRLKKTNVNDKSLTLSGTGFKFVNMANKSAPSTSLALTVSGALNDFFEIHILDSGLLDSTDRVLTVTLV